VNQKRRKIYETELRTTSLNQILLEKFLEPGCSVMDATAGNGHDSVFLLDKIIPGGILYAFDIQLSALERTKVQLEKLPHVDPKTSYHLICDSHGNLDQHLKEPVQAAVFNLGYLPGGDHSVTTNWDELHKALQLLTANWIIPGGIISIISYAGHPEGREEQKRLYQFVEGLPATQYNVHVTQIWNTIRSAPVSFIIQCL